MKKKKKVTVSTPVKELARSEELRHYMSILIEDFQSKLDLVVEGIEALRSEMRSEIKILRNDLENQFSLTNAAIRCNADGIRELRADVGHVKSEMREVKGFLNHLVDRVDNHEERMGRVEKVS